MANVKQITSCRICNNEELITIFDLGDLMINCFVEEPGDHKGEAPLKLQRCSECDLIQLSHTVREEDLYTNYWYLSRLNKKIVDNLESIVEDAQKECPLEDDDIVIDIGANDGTLLSFYPDNVITVGVDPAENIHAELKENCSIMIPGFFNYRNYMNKMPNISFTGPNSFHASTRQAKIITAVAMFYDLDDPNEFVQDIKQILQDDGLFLCQLMPARPMIDANDIGNIIHEHLEYYTYKSLVNLFEPNGLEIYDVRENDINGGSYQLFIRHYQNGSIEYPEDCSDERIERWINIMKCNKIDTMNYLHTLKEQGKNVYIMGASTKGNTIMQYYGIDNTIIKGAAEIHPDKIGKYLVGSGIPIVHEDDAKKDADAFLVFPFHFKELFVNKIMKDWIAEGGQLIFCTPKFEVISNENTFQ